MIEWGVYRGGGPPHDGVENLPDPPPWRVFDRDAAPVGPPAPAIDREVRRAATYQPDARIVELVNAALFLRRPALVTGPPGSGKSTLAYAVAHELGLGRVLHWPITSRVMMRDGLYRYDPLGRLYTVSSGHSDGRGRHSVQPEQPVDPEDVGQHVTLGPLGTALLPWRRPRVLLIDEIDKSDLDFPNDLLTIFEEGEFTISELRRESGADRSMRVYTANGTDRVEISGGQVRCREFPFVVMTSNNEREFPPAFLRRCIQIKIGNPNEDKLAEIVKAHLGDLADSSDALIRAFVERRNNYDLATDQLLNAIYLTAAAADRGYADTRELAEKIMSPISTPIEHDED